MVPGTERNLCELSLNSLKGCLLSTLLFSRLPATTVSLPMQTDIYTIEASLAYIQKDT